MSEQGTLHELGARAANDGYAARFGREFGADIEPDSARVSALIRARGVRSKRGYVWHYRSLVAELGGDHRLAQVSLHELAEELELEWLGNGVIVMGDK